MGYNVFISHITLSIFCPKFHEICVRCNVLVSGFLYCKTFFGFLSLRYGADLSRSRFVQCFDGSMFQAILTGGVLYRSEPFHRECFCCANCSKNLMHEKFTSRDDKPYCAQCFAELFARKCTTCAKPITGKPRSANHC